MKGWSFSASRSAQVAWTLALVVAVTAVPAPAWGADRLVLCEEFTNTG